MKKKLLLIVSMLALLVCLFAISVSAATIYKDANGTELFRYETFASADEVTAHFGFQYNDAVGAIKTYTGSFPKTNEQGVELTWYVTATATEGSDTVITVASGTTVGDVGTVSEEGVYSYNSGFKKENIVSANFPDNAGIKKLGFGSYGSYSSPFPKANHHILFLYCPNTLTEFGFNFIQSMPVIVCEIDDETPVTEIPQNFAHDARNLREINIPASVVTINGNSNSQGAPFYRNVMLQSVTFASDENLTTMKNFCFSDCISLTQFKIPNSVTQIGGQCFQNCKSLEKIWLGASLEKTTSISVFRLANSLKVYYVPSSFTTVNQHTFTHDSGNGPTDTVFFYAGTRAEFDVFYNAAVAGKNNQRVTVGYKEDYIVEWDPTKADSYYTDLATAEGHKLYVINYNACQAFYDGEHSSNGSSCKRCGAIVYCEDPTHNLEISISYESFVSEGVKSVKCLDCNSSAKESKVSPLFACLGYSAPEKGTSGIAIGFTVNDAAIAEYTEATGKTLKYGVFAVLKDTLGENDVFGKDGTAADGVINADLSNQKFSAFEIKVIGFADEQKDIKLAMGAYVAVTYGEATEYSYMQVGTPSEGEKYCFVSYNDIA